MNLLSYFLYFSLLVGFIAWYTPYYNERLTQYKKHHFVLTEECWEGKFHPKVQHNKMTYDGLSTNCTEASVFISVPVWLGALNNMWEGSLFYTLLHATNWQLQVAYVIFGLVIAVVSIWEVSKHIKWRKVSEVLKNQPKIEFKDQTTGRTRIMLTPKKSRDSAVSCTTSVTTNTNSNNNLYTSGLMNDDEIKKLSNSLMGKPPFDQSMLMSS